MLSSSMNKISTATASGPPLAAGPGTRIAAAAVAVASLVAAATAATDAENGTKPNGDDGDDDRIRVAGEGRRSTRSGSFRPRRHSSHGNHAFNRSKSSLLSDDRNVVGATSISTPSILFRTPFTVASPSSSSLLPLFPTQQRCWCEPSSSSSTTASADDAHRRRLLNIQRSRTLRILTSKATSHRTLSSLYSIDWDQVPMGEGAFGHVLMARSHQTGERVALKRIPKKLASREDFQREMEALLRIQKWGGHPHICALREHFDEGGHYCLILDLVEGGEMFDHLVNHGAYSEADAARLVREVASALDFLHGIGVVHNDVKPENLMLSAPNREDGSIQLVDFGCAEVEGEDDDDDDHDVDEVIGGPRGGVGSSARGGGKGGGRGKGGCTPAYSSPEAFEDRDAAPLPPADMW